MTEARAFNINQTCTAVLLQRGVMAITEYFRDSGEEREYKVGEEYVGPLWELMAIFGPLMRMGPEPPIETTINIYPMMYTTPPAAPSCDDRSSEDDQSEDQENEQ